MQHGTTMGKKENKTFAFTNQNVYFFCLFSGKKNNGSPNIPNSII